MRHSCLKLFGLVGENQKRTGLVIWVLYCILFRNKTKQSCNQHLLKIVGVESKGEVAWYMGKKVAFRWKAATEKNGTRNRVMWGKVCWMCVSSVVLDGAQVEMQEKEGDEGNVIKIM